MIRKISSNKKEMIYKELSRSGTIHINAFHQGDSPLSDRSPSILKVKINKDSSNFSKELIGTPSLRAKGNHSPVLSL